MWTIEYICNKPMVHLGKLLTPVWLRYNTTETLDMAIRQAEDIAPHLWRTRVRNGVVKVEMGND